MTAPAVDLDRLDDAALADRLQGAGQRIASELRKVIVGQDVVVEQALIALFAGGNVLLEGLAPWAEFDLVGQTIALGGARLVVTKRIERCAATNVDPATGVRDMQIPHALDALYGHHDCGVYARVAASGRVAVGDALAPVAPTLL